VAGEGREEGEGEAGGGGEERNEIDFDHN